jgi:hypothetical protein
MGIISLVGFRVSIFYSTVPTLMRINEDAYFHLSPGYAFRLTRPTALAGLVIVIIGFRLTQPA